MLRLRVRDIIRVISIVIFAIVGAIPMNPTLRWILIALAAIGLMLSSAIYEHEITRRTRRRLMTILIWVLIAASAGGVIATSVIKERTVAGRVDELEYKVEELEREVVFLKAAEPVMEAPREISPAPIPTPSREIQIKAPQDGSQVPWRPYVEGTVADPNATVWVIVHPMDVSSYWVQPSVTVKEDGTWKVQLYLGRAGDIDVDKQFAIMAIANPEKELSEAKVLGRWPEAQWKSQVIEVTRK